MPRTKAPTKKKTNDDQHIITQKICEELRKTVDERKAARARMLESLLQSLDLKFRVNLTAIPVSYMDKTLGELELQKNSIMQSICDNFSTDSLMCVTQSVKRKQKNPNKRSRSFAEDDGYLTAESNDSKLSGKRASRSRSSTKKLVPKKKRNSRSLSKTNMLQPGSTTNLYKTPANTKQPTTLGMVTPKMKANTPQVMLRRPKQGEVAISLQGSPLMVNGVVSDQVANVNIPLQDGRLLSLQPQRGLRISQIPVLDLDTQRQLQALRDNLNEVCEYAAGRY